MIRRSVVLLAPLPLVLTACTLWPRSPKPTRYYTIDIPPSASPAPRPIEADSVLAVATFDAPGHYRERIVCRDADHRVAPREYDRWVEPPAELVGRALERSLERALAKARLPRHVVPERLDRHADVVLTGKLLRFDATRGPQQWSAECEIQIVLNDARSHKILLARRFEASRAVSDPKHPPAKGRAAPKEPNVPLFVKAMNAAVGDLVAQATAAIASALDELPARPTPPPNSRAADP